MKTPYFVLIAFCFTLGACATHPITREEAEPIPASEQSKYKTKSSESDGLLVVIRDSGVQAHGCGALISVNNEPIATLRSGQKVEMWVPSGHVFISSTSKCPIGSDTKIELDMELKPNQTRFYRVQFNNSMFFSPLSI